MWSAQSFLDMGIDNGGKDGVTLKSLYSNKEGESEETESREGVEDMLKKEKELTKKMCQSWIW
jgi:hypothetical protein